MRTLGLILLCFLQLACVGQEQQKEAPHKINGVSFVASRDSVLQKNVNPILNVNANHASLMPYGFVQNLNSPDLIFDNGHQWFGETRDGTKQYTSILHKNNIKVMLKPHIWVKKGEFTGVITMTNEDDWKTFEASFEKFALHFAELAQEAEVDIYCIGTELELFIKNRPEFWFALIKKIRAIYKGKLTYAANWDEYTRTPFWNELDYIGVDAYFPLSEEKNPDRSQLTEGWKKWKTALKSISTTTNKPVLFTEYGYRSMDYFAQKPWLIDHVLETVNLEGQALATDVIIKEFWNEDWFAGGYIWKWFIHHDKVGGPENNRFTPQNKPAEETLKQAYKSY